ncbi:MAG: RNA polymerase sigma factor [Chloroflexi bacterium]|nr:RNA polymerase sigma factor [Chloroflexota bacterium]
MDTEHERHLIQQAQLGTDPAAIQTLYRQYFPRVFAYVAYRVGRKQDAEDIVSDIFLRAIEYLGHFEYRGEGSFAAWLFKIAYTQVVNFHRIHSPQQPVPLEELPDIQSDTLSPDSAILQKELFARLHHLITTLAPRRQEVITLKFFGGLRNQEIAELLGLDERTIASHLSRGLEDLQRKFEEEKANHE